MTSGTQLAQQQIFADSLAPGTLFADRYEIFQLIGRGGMGAVYKALDRIGGEVLALKVSPSSMPDNVAAERFRQEVAIARKLSHPNIVRVYDIGTEGEIRFISMEWIDGRDLGSLLNERGKLSIVEFAPIFRQLWSALDHVHSNRIIHRDIKLRNFMQARDGTLKLTDFGIAQMADEAGCPPAAFGTPGYLAPEILGGRGAGPASDIFAAAVACLELLTGIKAAESQEFDETVIASKPLARLLFRCLNPDPEQRPASAATVLQEGLAILKGELPAMPSLRTLSDLISQEPAHPDVIVPLMAGIAGRASELPAEQVGLSPQAIRIQTDGTIVIDATTAAAARYSAPEWFRETGADDARNAPVTRVYVLGFIFFEVLVGRRIFEQLFRDVLQGGEDLSWLEWHGNSGKALPPLHDLLPDYPPAVCEIVDQMLCKKVDQRLSSLSEVAERLRGIGCSFEHTIVQKVHPPRPPFWTAGRVLLLSALLASGVLAATWHYYRQIFTQVVQIFLKREEPVVAAAAAPAPPPAPETTAAAPVADAPVAPAKPVEPPLPEMIDTRGGQMVLIPAADFEMGNDAGRVSARYDYHNEAPAHTVHLDSYYLDVTEVRNADYRAFCRSAGIACPGNPPWDAHYSERDNYPVMNVSWDDAQAFCSWAGKALPTEAQWEHAARGKSNTLYPWGDQQGDAQSNLKGNDDGYAYAAPAGSFAGDRSDFGVMDLAGNLPEWTADDYALYPGNPSRLPAEEQAHKVIRGGGFMTPPELARATNRASAAAHIVEGKTLQVGFRCAASADTVANAVVKR